MIAKPRKMFLIVSLPRRHEMTPSDTHNASHSITVTVSGCKTPSSLAPRRAPANLQELASPMGPKVLPRMTKEGAESV